MQNGTLVILVSSHASDRFIDSYRRALDAGFCPVCAADEAIAEENSFLRAQLATSLMRQFDGATVLN